MDALVILVAAACFAIAAGTGGDGYAGAAVVVAAIAVVTVAVVVIFVIVTLTGPHVQADAACTCKLAIAHHVAEAVCTGVAWSWPVRVGAVGVLGEGAFGWVSDSNGQAVAVDIAGQAAQVDLDAAIFADCVAGVVGYGGVVDGFDGQGDGGQI